MCRAGGRRCGRAYNMNLNLSEIRTVVAQAQKYRGNPDASNARRQPIRRLANYQRKLQAEAYNIDHALDALTADIAGRELIEGSVTVKGDDGQEFTLELQMPKPRFDGTGIEEQLTPEELMKISSKKLSMAQLKEKHPDVYSAIHTVNGKDSRDYLPEAFEAGEFEKRHSRYRNDYVKVVGDPDPKKVIDQIVYLTERKKEVESIRRDVKDTLSESLPVGTRMEAPWPQHGGYSSSSIEIVETHNPVNATSVRKWAKDQPEGRAQEVLDDISEMKPDSAKIKRHMGDLYASRTAVTGKPKIKVTKKDKQ